jgi:hypothetical protein
VRRDDNLQNLHQQVSGRLSASPWDGRWTLRDRTANRPTDQSRRSAAPCRARARCAAAFARLPHTAMLHQRRCEGPTAVRGLCSRQGTRECRRIERVIACSDEETPWTAFAMRDTQRGMAVSRSELIWAIKLPVPSPYCSKPDFVGWDCATSYCVSDVSLPQKFRRKDQEEVLDRIGLLASLG